MPCAFSISVCSCRDDSTHGSRSVRSVAMTKSLWVTGELVVPFVVPRDCPKPPAAKIASFHTCLAINLEMSGEIPYIWREEQKWQKIQPAPPALRPAFPPM